MNIAIATGGSLGHIMPAVLLAQYLQNNGHAVVMVGPLKKWDAFIQQYAIPTYFVNALPIRMNIGSFKNLLENIKNLKNYFLQRKIETVVGFGSYASVPGVLAAKLIRARIILHEQNVVPGRANRFLRRSAHKVAVSFLPTLKYFKYDQAVMTGCPNLFAHPLNGTSDVYEELSFDEDVPIILVFGGSQGSQDINKLFAAAADTIKEELAFQVVHICGKDDVDAIAEKYKGLNIKAQVYDFVYDMSKLYAVATLVISRAGALTVTELAHLHKKAILIPYPHANAHQFENARVLQQTGLADIYRGSDAIELAGMVIRKIKETIDYECVSTKVSELFRKNAQELLAQEVLCES